MKRFVFWLIMFCLIIFEPGLLGQVVGVISSFFFGQIGQYIMMGFLFLFMYTEGKIEKYMALPTGILIIGCLYIIRMNHMIPAELAAQIDVGIIGRVVGHVMMSSTVIQLIIMMICVVLFFLTFPKSILEKIGEMVLMNLLPSPTVPVTPAMSMGSIGTQPHDQNVVISPPVEIAGWDDFGQGDDDGLPPLSILKRGNESHVDPAVLHQYGEQIKSTMNMFGVKVNIVKQECGRRLVKFSVKPKEDANGKIPAVSKIMKTEENLKLALAVNSLMMSMESGNIVIEFPIENPGMVTLGDVLIDQKRKLKKPLQFCVGQDSIGNPITAVLDDKMPHLLTAGQTGSGKSVCVNSIIINLIMRNDPDQLKFLMIDPKQVELIAYQNLPHLRERVITDMDKAVVAIQNMVTIMVERYTLLKELGVRNIADYNKKKKEQTMAHIVIIIDEFASLMETHRDHVESNISRLTAESRSVGIHLVLATQRPSADIINGKIKANLPGRIAFSLPDAINSKIALGQPGAEKLLGNGDGLFIGAGSSNPVRFQGCFVSDDEIKEVVKFWEDKKNE